jgi:uridine kinase/ribulose-5-phosphate 4-epimerase/fuculose-1-phosphate aldolase
MSSFIIGISGPSGVGKTTISYLLSYLFNSDDVLILSGDDLHKWGRNDPNWDNYTHFNPNANNLDLGYKHLYDLKNGKTILRKKYNHDTGTFDNDVEIKSSPIIIYEGLHSLFSKEMCDLIDLKIYVDTDESLTKEWKIKRDTLSRGYSSDNVIKIMDRRKEDEIKYIIPQKNNSDVVIKFNKLKKIKLTYKVKNNLNKKNKDIIVNLKKIYGLVSKFLKISDFLSTDISLVQGKGGNFSCKFGDKFLIKSSGFKMQDITFTDGFTICKRQNKIHFNNENEYEKFSKESVFYSNVKPSMEIGFHNNIDYDVVIHTHPIYLNTILCSKESKSIIVNLFNDLNFQYVEYVTPGYELSNCFLTNNDCKIFFLENHGLVVCSNKISESINLTKKINNRCEKWLLSNTNEFIQIKKNIKNNHLFPDSAVFTNELHEINLYIINLIYKCGLTPRFLSSYEINKISNLKSEIYRKK